MDSDVDYWIDEPAELEGEDTFRPSWRGISVRLLLLVLLLWTLIQMVLPRRNLNLQIDQPPNPPAEPIEPNYWL
jgi:hypothetical protein